ncbi:Guanylate kinase [Gloeomargarita lithophora Alchichica-D10]|uniref:Guanylate kinase n=1 Tax=Gloeomargarita lithophora Alchichica-D10 TaxID=1188229 RepID=A0A1J0AD84_9CYAN|nr:guanylate kinase [Gloeomargarita lithophora]APB33900.1 Guanylate kinase [Gloeomargarita lithophora Alchichica-D10]
MTEGRLIVLTGPSGVGKGTLLKHLCQRHPALRVSVSLTTRAPRPGEIPGQSYIFVSREEFQSAIAAGALLEWAEYAGNYYGTPRQPVVAALHQGQWVILEIEVVGARQIRQNFPQAQLVFICPPAWATLEQRLKQRGQDSETAIQKRLARAKDELQAAPEFDAQVVNDNLEQAIQELEIHLGLVSENNFPIL